VAVCSRPKQEQEQSLLPKLTRLSVTNERLKTSDQSLEEVDDVVETDTDMDAIVDNRVDGNGEEQMDTMEGKSHEYWTVILIKLLLRKRHRR